MPIADLNLPPPGCRWAAAALCGLQVSRASAWLAQALLSPSIQVRLSIDRKPAGQPIKWPSTVNGQVGEGTRRVSVFKCFETLSGFSRTEALARLLFQIRRLCAGTAIVVV